jgi:hypothetical protein
MEEFQMKMIFSLAALFAFTIVNAAGQAKKLANDPLTGLPLSPATYGGQYIGNEPDKMPDGQVCKGKMQGNNYSLFDIKTDAAIPWYASHLAGFKKIQGYESGRSQTAFYNSDGSIVIFLTAQPGTQGENTDAYSVAYERFQPGISEKNDLCLNARENNLPVTTWLGSGPLTVRRSSGRRNK